MLLNLAEPGGFLPSDILRRSMRAFSSTVTIRELQGSSTTGSLEATWSGADCDRTKYDGATQTVVGARKDDVALLTVTTH
jgi:hypothetical protein